MKKRRAMSYVLRSEGRAYRKKSIPAETVSAQAEGSRKERKQGLATLHQKQKRIPLLYCPQREGRSSCPASSSLFYRYSSHSQYCLENEGKDHKSCSNYFL